MKDEIKEKAPPKLIKWCADKADHAMKKERHFSSIIYGFLIIIFGLGIAFLWWIKRPLIIISVGLICIYFLIYYFR